MIHLQAQCCWCEKWFEVDGEPAALDGEPTYHEHDGEDFTFCSSECLDAARQQWAALEDK